MSVLGRRSRYLLYGLYAFGWSMAALFMSVSWAAPLKSSNYQFEETSLGGTGLLQASSPDFQAQESGGIIGVGTSTDSGAQLEAGHETTNDPALGFTLNNSSGTFGSFSPTSTATATTTFSVSDYTSYGYIVQIYGTPPSNGQGHTIPGMGTNASPTPGIEQYGINLVANTQPISFGANPNFGQFGSGSVATNYNTANSFRYVSGDTIAQSGKSSGMTTYTLSYIVDVSDVTPGGQYQTAENLICTGTY